LTVNSLQQTSSHGAHPLAHALADN
jgi:hypothetical protein